MSITLCSNDDDEDDNGIIGAFIHCPLVRLISNTRVNCVLVFVSENNAKTTRTQRR